VYLSPAIAVTDSDKEAPNAGGVGAIMTILAWILVLGLLGAFFSGWMEKLNNPNQQVRTELHADGVREVVLRQNRAGHYVANGTINGHPVTFLLDTGATSVSVPARVATPLGLKRGAPLRATTANGTVTTYATRLDEVQLGNIALENVRADINPHMQGDEVLLGMSFLRKLEFTQRNRELTIRQ
jgi:aspartyl protease family protein